MQERKPGCICELNSETVEPVVANYAECPVHKPDAISPKDTAIRLVDGFYNVYGGIQRHQAQECAIMEVNDILSILEPFKGHEYAKVLIPFYQNVKQEIQNL